MDSSSKDVQNLTNDEYQANLNNSGSSTADIKIYNSIEEFDKNLPHTITVLTTPQGSKVYLVGTAHFSRESQDDVSLVSNVSSIQRDCRRFLIVFFFAGD